MVWLSLEKLAKQLQPPAKLLEKSRSTLHFFVQFAIKAGKILSICKNLTAAYSKDSIRSYAALFDIPKLNIIAAAESCS